MSQARLYLTTRKPEANHIASILDPFFEDEGIPAALFEDKDNPGNWCWSIYVASEDRDHWRDYIIDWLGGDGFSLTIETEILGDVDWVSATLRELAPVKAGRFFILPV